MQKKEKQKLHLLTQQIYCMFLKTNAADAKTKQNCLINLISRLQLELKNLKAFASDGVSVMTGFINGVAARLRENQNFKTYVKGSLFMLSLGVRL